MATTKTQSVPQANTVSITLIHGGRRVKQNSVIDFITSMDRPFNIHEIYAAFPGKESSVQGYLSTLSSAGVLEKMGEHGSGDYRPVNDRIGKLTAENQQLRAENADLLDSNYELSLQLERMVKELTLLRESNATLSQSKIQNNARSAHRKVAAHR